MLQFYPIAVFLYLITFASATELDYDDQENWPDFCQATDQQQSPIDIVHDDAVSCGADRDSLRWNIDDVDDDDLDYTVSFGHSLTFVPSDTTAVSLLNNFAPSNGEHATYNLAQFHVHWDSEHHFDGEQSELEAHFVHIASEYDSVGDAAAGADTTDAYTIAVVAVLFDVHSHHENDFLKKLIEHDDFGDLTEGAGNELELTGADVNKLLPDLEDEGDYYHYYGSLTTPGCNPVVQWYVLKEKLTISEDQLEELKSIHNEDGHTVDTDCRDCHPLASGNQVRFCESDSSDSGDSAGNNLEVADTSSYATESSTSTSEVAKGAAAAALLLAGCLLGVLATTCGRKCASDKSQKYAGVGLAVTMDDESDVDDVKEGRDRVTTSIHSPNSIDIAVECVGTSVPLSLISR